MEYIQCFLDSLIAEKGLAKNTAASYRSDLEKLQDYYKGKLLQGITKDEIHAYIQQLSSKEGLKSSSISRKISTFKHFYKFLYKEKFIDSNPASDLLLPKKERLLPKPITEKEILKLLEIAEEDQTPKGIRTVAILEILYSSGMRVSELIAIKMSDIKHMLTYQKDHIIINGKGNKERVVFLGVML